MKNKKAKILVVLSGLFGLTFLAWAVNFNPGLIGVKTQNSCICIGGTAPIPIDVTIDRFLYLDSC